MVLVFRPRACSATAFKSEKPASRPSEFRKGDYINAFLVEKGYYVGRSEYPIRMGRLGISSGSSRKRTEAKNGLIRPRFRIFPGDTAL